MVCIVLLVLVICGVGLLKHRVVQFVLGYWIEDT